MKEGNLFTVVPRVGSRMHEIGDRSYMSDIFLCISAEIRHSKRIIISGVRLKKHEDKTLTRLKKDSFMSGISEFAAHEYDIEFYDGDFKYEPKKDD